MKEKLDEFWSDLEPLLKKWVPIFVSGVKIQIKKWMKWIKDYLRQREEEKNKQSKAISKDKL